MLDGNEKNPRMKLFETFGASVQALKSGDVDLVLMERPRRPATSAPRRTPSRSIGEPLGTEEFGFIFKQGSDLVAPVNAAIAAMKADGTFDKLNKKWFFDYQAGK